ncbi:Calcineurin-like phosphoesterase [Arcticibacter svalbardensis MN12-7]|uniref:Calcineurin-like phosphoesterase n=1 Tax=Arcticibacter svalbardensis MN12-7 TaxID=1150600 RepID=R9GPT2_9SPHI|nr:metallophosphoesterase [Arcticibacter svalbardensis]EOR93852.1 Calcineurin-like phosphoesterase [Arcticibacter svalbardensis MN12-7]
MNYIFGYLFIVLGLFCSSLQAQTAPAPLQVAFLADVHLQDLYGELKGSDFKGVLNPKTGKYTLLRTMDAQLHSTRIYNENYFAFLAALDDIAKRGIHYVALPGDYSDDGQPLHIRGLKGILKEYSEKYGIEFFITTGNHDPSGPFSQDAGKSDFLGEGGRKQAIYSKMGMFEIPGLNELPVVVSPDLAKMGYLGITDQLREFGFYPKSEYLFWATPFSGYTSLDYSYEKAKQAAGLEKRVYEVAPGRTLPDVSYVVEPVKGLWLLALDGNVYPKADLGYNNVLLHKKHLVEWTQKIAAEARKQGKTLIAFSHYPMVDFNDGASPEIKEMMGAGKWQLDRVPRQEVALAFADAGIKVHFGGHMHINDTGVYTSQKGNTLVNIQTPSLAAYIPAYKLLTIRPHQVLEVETVVIAQVPRFDDLFDLYRMEHRFLESQHAQGIWDSTILQTKSYHDFTDFHLRELVRLRFLPDDWPPVLKDFLLPVSGDDLLVLATMNLSVSFDTILKHKERYKQAWNKAEKTVDSKLMKLGLKSSAFKKWNGLDLITDFYRIRNADQLALADIGVDRVRQYQILSKCFFENHPEWQKKDPLQKKLGLFFKILDKFLHDAPADHFLIHLDTGKVQDISSN